MISIANRHCLKNFLYKYCESTTVRRVPIFMFFVGCSDHEIWSLTKWRFPLMHILQTQNHEFKIHYICHYPENWYPRINVFSNYKKLPKTKTKINISKSILTSESRIRFVLFTVSVDVFIYSLWVWLSSYIHGGHGCLHTDSS